MRTKKLLAILLALMLVISVIPTSALADETGEDTTTETVDVPAAEPEDEEPEDEEPEGEPVVLADNGLPAAVGGVITLTEDVTLAGIVNVGSLVNDKIIAAETIDLAGHTLTVGRLDAYDLTIKDSSEEQSGVLTSSGGITCVVFSGFELTIESGAVQNEAAGGTTIFNMGAVTVNGGAVSGETAIYNSATNGGEVVNGNVVCNINGGTINVGTYGICAFGAGFDENGNVDNGKVTINIDGGKIIGQGDCQGIATNASSGQNAGFTINMTDGEIDVGDSGCGMYLPAIGVTNISGGSVSGGQAIRICAGELNITGGTITGTTLSDGEDLQAGGSGGTQGAIVVGKAGTGYVGDISVNISEDAVIENTAEGEGTKPTIVVSDKNMALNSEQLIKNPDGTASDATFNYSETSITVVVDGAAINGDVVKISNLKNTETSDGGDTTLTIQNTTVAGDITNQSKTGLVIQDTTVTGGVENTSSGSTAVLGESKVKGNATAGPNDAGGTLYIENAEDDSTVAINSRTAKAYADLEEALAAAKSGDTVTLLSDVTVKNDPTSGSGTSVINVPEGVTLDGAGHKITAGEDFALNSAGKANNSIVGAAAGATIKNLTIVGNEKTKHGINAYNAGTDEEDKITLENVTIQNCGNAAITNNGSYIVADGLTTKDNAWGAVNVDNSGKFELISGDLTENSQIWSEDADEENGSQVTVPEGWQEITVDKEDDSEDGKVHYTSDPAKYGEAAIETEDGVTVYDTVERALEAAESGDSPVTVTVIKDAALDDGGTVPENVELVVDKGVTLTIPEGKELTNNGKVTAHGRIVGTVSGNGKQAVAFNLVGPNTTAYQGDSGAERWTTVTSDDIDGEIRLGDVEWIPSDTDNIPDGYSWTYRGVNVYATKGDDETKTYIAKNLKKWTDAVFQEMLAKKNDGWTLWVNAAEAGMYIPSSGSHGSSSSGSSVTTYPVTVDSAKHGTVTASAKNASRGTTVTITVKPDDGYELDSLTVTDKDGKTVKVTEGKNGKFTFTMPASKVTIEADFAKAQETPDQRFTDVPAGYWAEDEINWAAENGYMNGNTATTFNPEGSVTRQQLWMILARLSGYQPADFAEAKAWAVDNRISDGTNPGNAVTRQQLVTILYRYAVMMGYKTTGAADLTRFPDHASVAAYATDAMSWSVANGIVGGTTAGTLNPAGTATRAQFAVILYRFCEKVVG